jgi:hypothetical protein
MNSQKSLLSQTVKAIRQMDLIQELHLKENRGFPNNQYLSGVIYHARDQRQRHKNSDKQQPSGDVVPDTAPMPCIQYADDAVFLAAFVVDQRLDRHG